MGGSLLLRGLVVLGPGSPGEVVQAARRCSDGAGVVDRLDGEQVSERVFEVVVDDLVVVDEDVLEDGLVEASADFVAGVAAPAAPAPSRWRRVARAGCRGRGGGR